MDDQTKRRLGLEAAKFPITCCLPILIADNPNIATYINSGSMTLFESSKGIIGITCSHVIEEYEAKSLQGVCCLIEVGMLKIDLTKHLVSRHQTLDLATFLFTTQEYEQMKLDDEIGNNCLSIIYNKAINVGDFITIGGYPGQWRDQINKTTIRFDSFSFAGCSVATSFPDSFTCRIEDLNEWPRTFDNHNRSIPSDPGGLSGGPILMHKLAESGFFHWELAGIITEGLFFDDTLVIYGVPAKYIKPDGSVSDN